VLTLVLLIIVGGISVIWYLLISVVVSIIFTIDYVLSGYDDSMAGLVFFLFWPFIVTYMVFIYIKEISQKLRE